MQCTGMQTQWAKRMTDNTKEMIALTDTGLHGRTRLLITLQSIEKKKKVDLRWCN